MAILHIILLNLAACYCNTYILQYIHVPVPVLQYIFLDHTLFRTLHCIAIPTEYSVGSMLPVRHQVWCTCMHCYCNSMLLCVMCEAVSNSGSMLPVLIPVHVLQYLNIVIKSIANPWKYTRTRVSIDIAITRVPRYVQYCNIAIVHVYSSTWCTALCWRTLVRTGTQVLVPV